MLAQALVTLVACVGFATDSMVAGMSALTGGGISIIGTLVQGRMLRGQYTSAEAVYRDALRLQVRKWVLMACMFALAFGVWRNSQPLPLLLTFALAQAGHLAAVFAPMFDRRRRRSRPHY